MIQPGIVDADRVIKYFENHILYHTIKLEEDKEKWQIQRRHRTIKTLEAGMKIIELYKLSLGG